MIKLSKLVVALSLGMASSTIQADDLFQIYQQSQEKDPVILQAKASRDSAFEQISASRASLLPQIGFEAGINYSKYNDGNLMGGTKSNAQIGLSQALYRRNSWISTTISEKQATQQDAFYALAKQQLILRVSQAYFDVLKAKDNLSFVISNKEAIKRQLDQTSQRFNVGLTAITDVHEAQAEYDRANANEINARNTLTNSYLGLQELTGFEHKSLNVLDTVRFSAPASETTSADWKTISTDKNLQLHVQRIAKEIAMEQISLAESGHQPTLDLVAGIGYNKNDPSNESAFNFKSDTNAGNIGLQFNLPIYTGGAISAQSQQAQYGFIIASQELERAYREVNTSVQSSYNNVNAIIGSIKAFEQTVISAESALKATEAGFEVGTRTIVDVLNATRNLYSAKQQLSDSRYNYILSMLALKQAGGTLTEADLLAINTGLIPDTQK